MSRFPLYVLVLAWLPLLIGCGGKKVPVAATKPDLRADNKISADALTALEHAEQFELFSIEPDRAKEPSKEHLHGWEIVGKTPIDSMATWQKIVAALQKGVADYDGTDATCFNPRHGIRTYHDGKTVEFVVCFQCFQVRVFEGEKEQSRFRLAKSPQPVFDQILTDAHVPLAKKATE